MELTNDEKITIIEQHLRSMLFSQYNLNLQLSELRAVSTPNQETIDAVTKQMSDVQAQIDYLNAEAAKLQPTTTN